MDSEKEKFHVWYNTKLKVGYMPTFEDNIPEYIKDYNTIINVSDFSDFEYVEKVIGLNKKYFWFPMNEVTGDMGINSIYGSLNILYQSFQRNESVYLHCFLGKNRSRVIEASFYYMMTGEHLTQISKSHQNRIFSNSSRGHLPEVSKFELFLNNCHKVFSVPYVEPVYGPIDYCKLRSL